MIGQAPFSCVVDDQQAEVTLRSSRAHKQLDLKLGNGTVIHFDLSKNKPLEGRWNAFYGHLATCSDCEAEYHACTIFPWLESRLQYEIKVAVIKFRRFGETATIRKAKPAKRPNVKAWKAIR